MAAMTSSFKISSDDDDLDDSNMGRCCGGKAPLVASLTALALIVVVAFVGLLVVLDRLQLDAADHARTATIRGALDFTASAVGAVFEETRVLALRLARDRKYAVSTPTCLNESAPLHDVYFPFLTTMNSTVQPLFAVYETLLATGVPQSPSQLTYIACGIGKNIFVYRTTPEPRQIQYDVAQLPDVVGDFNGQWGGDAWNQTSMRYVAHTRTLRQGTAAEVDGDWGEPEIWVQPLNKKRTLYLTITLPIKFNGPTVEPSAAVSIDVDCVGLEPLLRQVKLEDSQVALIDPRPSPVLPNLVPANGLLLANTFSKVPAMNDEGIESSTPPSLWAADATPDENLNAAVKDLVAKTPGGLLALTGVMEIPDGPDGTVVGATSIVLPGDLRLVALTMTPRSVFYGNLRAGRKISWSVGAACGFICLVAIVAFVLISNNAARRLLAHVMSHSGRDIRSAPKDQTKPFAIAFTDIQSSTALWARLPQEMGPALDTHHDVIRRCIGRHGGYEVKTIGDSFMVAFEDPASAVSFALDVQTELHSAHWGADDEISADIFSRMYDEFRPTQASFKAFESKTSDTPDSPTSPRCAVDPQLWSGLRVRVGVHYGTGSIVHDEVTKGYDYYGTVVNTAARVEAVAHGGQVVVTQDVVAALDRGANDTIRNVDALALGPHSLRGLEEPVELVQLLPERFKGRTFPPLRHDPHPDSDETSAERQAADDRADKSYALSDSPSICLSCDDGLDASLLTQESEKDVYERIWRRHNVSMSFERFSLCCEAVRAVTASLSDAQRAMSLRSMARRWRVRHSTRNGSSLPETILIAFMMARAAPRVDLRLSSSAFEHRFSKSPNSPVGSLLDSDKVLRPLTPPTITPLVKKDLFGGDTESPQSACSGTSNTSDGVSAHSSDPASRPLPTLPPKTEQSSTSAQRSALQGEAMFSSMDAPGSQPPPLASFVILDQRTPGDKGARSEQELCRRASAPGVPQSSTLLDARSPPSSHQTTAAPAAPVEVDTSTTGSGSVSRGPSLDGGDTSSIVARGNTGGTNNIGSGSMLQQLPEGSISGRKIPRPPRVSTVSFRAEIEQDASSGLESDDREVGVAVLVDAIAGVGLGNGEPQVLEQVSSRPFGDDPGRGS